MSDLMLRALIYLKLSFVQGDKHGPICILLPLLELFVEDVVIFFFLASGEGFYKRFCRRGSGPVGSLCESSLQPLFL